MNVMEMNVNFFLVENKVNPLWLNSARKEIIAKKYITS